jgi:protein-disulfide isomerase
MNKLYLILGAVAVVGIGIVGYSIASNTLGAAVSEPIVVDGLEDGERLIEMAQGVTKGDPDAPVTIIEFGDYQCPGCGGFAMSVKPQVELALVETGQAKFVFYDFPLVTIRPNAFIAARAARCADDQDLFWEFHDSLFRNQPSWSAEANPMGSFRNYAETIGLDDETFVACVNSDRHADLVSANMQLGAALGVSGTPTLLVESGGQVRRLNNVDYQSIAEAVQSFSEGEGPSGN